MLAGHLPPSPPLRSLNCAFDPCWCSNPVLLHWTLQCFPRGAKQLRITSGASLFWAKIWDSTVGHHFLAFGVNVYINNLFCARYIKFIVSYRILAASRPTCLVLDKRFWRHSSRGPTIWCTTYPQGFPALWKLGGTRILPHMKTEIQMHPK
jgi:hypothetical protein